MTRQRTMTRSKGRPVKGRRLCLLLFLPLGLAAAGMAWKEYPSLVRYLKIARM
jgi:hypothetical protein